MPDNLAEPSHVLMREVAGAGPWAEKFRDPIAREAIGTPAAYYDLLQGAAARIDIWRTSYNHPLKDAAAIVEMVRSTGLRPYLARLDDDERAAYLVAYEAELAKAYPQLADGRVLFRFPRLFVVAARG
jgi:trans-aconitate 2-methyltransferase